jgi:PKD repeat protein
VTVNGLLAEVHGNDFAVIVPLEQGQNTLTAIATIADGVQTQASVTINTEAQQEFVRLTATPTSSILDQTGILNVDFEAEAFLENPVSSYSWDLNGDGVAEITGVAPSVLWEYQFPGLYFPKVIVTDNQGNSFTETTLVNVLSREEMDALLRDKWEGMKGALSQGDVDNALNYFVKDSREEYRDILELLASQLSSLTSAMREINMVEITGNMAEYYIKRFQRGVDISYFIYFMKDGDGIWKISSF